MDHNEVIATCARCGFIGVLRPYGCQDELICIDCARELNEPCAAITELVMEAAERMKRLG